MSSADPGIQEARKKLIKLIESDEWRLTDSAARNGRQVLQEHLDYPTDWDIVEFVLNLLKTGFPMHAIQMGEPPGSHGIGYVMNNADGRDLYIKVKIEDETAWLLSFKRSKHAQG